MERFLRIMAAIGGFFFAVAVMLFLTDPVHAASPRYCDARATLAWHIAQAMEDGTPIANINLEFEVPPATAELAQARERWVEALKAEVQATALAISGQGAASADAIARAIAEKCRAALTERSTDAGGRMIRAASSERIDPQRGPGFDDCSEQLVDQVFIGNMIGSGRATFDELRTIAVNSQTRLGAERFKAVWILLDEAEAAVTRATQTSQDPHAAIQKWFDGYWKACMQGAN